MTERVSRIISLGDVFDDLSEMLDQRIKVHALDGFVSVRIDDRIKPMTGING